MNDAADAVGPVGDQAIGAGRSSVLPPGYAEKAASCAGAAPEAAMERGHADEALRASYRRIVETANEGILKLDHNFRMVFVNSKLCEILGYAPEEIIGRAVVDFICEEELSHHQTEMNQREIGAGGRYERRLRCKDGSTCWVWVSAAPLADESGRFGGSFAMLTDITERKRAEEALRESEEQLKTIIRHVPLGISLMCRDQTFEYFNPRFSELLGYNIKDLPDRQHWIEKLFPVLGQRRENEPLWQKDAGETCVADFTYPDVRVRCKDDREKILNIRSVLIEDGKRLLTYEDVSEQRKLMAQLQRSQKLEVIGTLAGGIAHDFNNILAAIFGYTEMAMSAAARETAILPDLEQILRAAHRAKKLVRQILAFSHQKDVQERRPISICPIINEALMLLRATLPTTIELRAAIDPAAGTVRAEPTQLQQVVVNLCTNAAHAMRENGGILNVSLERLDLNDVSAAVHGDLRPGPYLRLSVSDTGHGMDAATLERIFDPYFTTKEVGEGTGLGLAVVQGIIKNHEGMISVQSRPGRGTAVHVLLPRIEIRPRQEMPNQPRLPRGTERILFVDDEKDLVELGKRTLRELGYKVTGMTNSLETVVLFRARPHAFDLVITDYTMPHMTGDRLARELLKIRADLPIILCSGFNDGLTPEQAAALGIREFAEKPLSMTDIAALIRKVMDPKPPAETLIHPHAEERDQPHR